MSSLIFSTMPRRLVVPPTPVARTTATADRTGTGRTCAYGVSVKAVDEARRTIGVRLSDDSVDRAGEVIPLHAWQTPLPESVPLLWSHDRSKPAIGRVVNLRLQRDGLYGDLKFPKSGVHPEADLVFALLREAVVQDVSVGFIPRGGIEAGPGGVPHYRFPVELIELSACNIGANPRARVVAKAARSVAAPSSHWAGYTLEVADDADELVLDVVDAPRRAVTRSSGGDPIEVIGPTGKRLERDEVEALIDAQIAKASRRAVDEVIGGVRARLARGGR